MNSRFISLISALVSGRKDNPSYRDPEWADPTPSWNNFCPRSERFSGQLDCPFQPRSCDQIERFFIISGTIFRTRVAHMFGNFLGYFEIHHSSSKNCCGYLLGHFLEILGYFVFHHLGSHWPRWGLRKILHKPDKIILYLRSFNFI